MNSDILLPFIPISLFLCIAWTIKAIVDSRVRKQLVSSNVSQDLVRSIIESEEARRRQADSLATKRLGRPEELGAACAFLCSAKAGFISGVHLHLDGGSYPGLV